MHPSLIWDFTREFMANGGIFSFIFPLLPNDYSDLMAARRGGAKCSCNAGWWIIGILLMAAGLWALASGFIAQLNAALDMVMIFGWYAGGVLLVSLGKMSMWKSCGSCRVHLRK